MRTADDGLPATAVERDAAAGADAARWRRPSGMVRLAPDTRAAGSGWQLDATAPAAIRADQRLEPGVDVGGTHPVGHDDGPWRLGLIPPVHVTEFRRNGVIRKTRPRAQHATGSPGACVNALSLPRVSTRANAAAGSGSTRATRPASASGGARQPRGLLSLGDRPRPCRRLCSVLNVAVSPWLLQSA